MLQAWRSDTGEVCAGSLSLEPQPRDARLRHIARRASLTTIPEHPPDGHNNPNTPRHTGEPAQPDRGVTLPLPQTTPTPPTPAFTLLSLISTTSNLPCTLSLVFTWLRGNHTQQQSVCVSSSWFDNAPPTQPASLYAPTLISSASRHLHSIRARAALCFFLLIFHCQSIITAVTLQNFTPISALCLWPLHHCPQMQSLFQADIPLINPKR